MPVFAVVVLALYRPAFVQRLDSAAYDTILRAASAPPPGDQVVIVDVDERSLSEVGQWPWPRDLIGLLVTRLTELEASVVGLDIIFAEADRYARYPSAAEGPYLNPESLSDRALADTLRQGRVVLGYAMTFDDNEPSPEDCVLHPLGLAVVASARAAADNPLFRASGAVCSLPVLAQAAGASGFLNTAPDPDGILRRVPLLVELEGRVYPGLPLASVMLASGFRSAVLHPLNRQAAELTLDDRVTIPLDGQGNLLVRFRGKRGTLPRLSAVDVLRGRIPADRLRGKVVFVGTTALGTREVVSTPLDTLFTGIEVQATVADNLLLQDFARRHEFNGLFEGGGVLSVGLGIAMLVARAGLRWGAVASLGTLGTLWFGSAWLVSSTGLFVSPLFPALGVVSVLACLTLARVITEHGQVYDATQALQEAKTDVLTNVPNRRAFEEFLTEQFERASSRRPLSVFFADIDRFKQFNDLHGHAVGDRVLIAFAQTLRTAAADQGHVFRVGGEEFAIVRPATARESALRFAEQLVATVADQTQAQEDGGRVLNIQCSIGVATHAGDTYDRQDQLLKGADLALYAAKAAGRNCVRQAETPSVDLPGHRDTQDAA